MTIEDLKALVADRIKTHLEKPEIQKAIPDLDMLDLIVVIQSLSLNAMAEVIFEHFQVKT